MPITRPRISPGTDICRMFIADVVNISVRKPVGTSTTATARKVGIRPAANSKTPKPIAAPRKNADPQRPLRRAATAAPARVPTASMVVSRPYASAPRSNVLRASTARLIGKFSPNVETMNTVPSSTRRSARPQT